MKKTILFIPLVLLMHIQVGLLLETKKCKVTRALYERFMGASKSSITATGVKECLEPGKNHFGCSCHLHNYLFKIPLFSRLFFYLRSKEPGPAMGVTSLFEGQRAHTCGFSPFFAISNQLFHRWDADMIFHTSFNEPTEERTRSCIARLRFVPYYLKRCKNIHQLSLNISIFSRCFVLASSQATKTGPPRSASPNMQQHPRQPQPRKTPALPQLTVRDKWHR